MAHEDVKKVGSDAVRLMIAYFMTMYALMYETNYR